jgi:hypothetical protein
VRQQTAQSYQGAYYGGGYYHDDDDWDDGEVAAVAVGAAALGAVGGYAAGQSSASSTVVYTTPPPAGYTSLPCTPSVIAVSGVTYYQCGSTWYTQAYGGSGVSYMVVAPPSGY